MNLCISGYYYSHHMLEPGTDFDDNNSDPPLSAQDDIIESDIELDNADVVEPDNDPPQFIISPCPITNTSIDCTSLVP